MAITHKLYGPGIQEMLKGGIALETHTIKVALMKTAHTFNQAHTNWGQISTNECDSADYTAKGETIGNKQVNYASRVTTFKTTDAKATFTSDGTISAAYAVVYRDSGSDATSFLISCIDFGGTESSQDGEFSIQWHADGIFTITVDA